MTTPDTIVPTNPADKITISAGVIDNNSENPFENEAPGALK